MRYRRFWLWYACGAIALAAIGCNPYTDYKLKGEFNAGSADPVNYPPPYRGVGSIRNVAGSGNGFTAVRAYAQGAGLEYYLFPYSPSQVVTAGYAAISLAAQTTNALSIRQFPLGYVFDPPNTSNPFPAQQQCRAPDGYQYDRRRDDVRYDEQGSIFTALPEATFGAGSLPTWTYYPIAREVAVGSNGEACQDIKSERTLLARGDVNVPKDSDGNPSPDGRYLAWALIDPGSGVYRVGEPSSGPGVGIQKWAWFQQFLVAYIDGGYIPVATGGTQFTSQILYIPSRVVTTLADGGPAPASNGRLGAGYDVLEFPRSDPRYSPICRIQIYNTGATPPLIRDLPQSAEAVRANYPPAQISNPPSPPAGGIAPSDVIPPFVFCLQAQ
jgi:hypothetical protein